MTPWPHHGLRSMHPADNAASSTDATKTTPSIGRVSAAWSSRPATDSSSCEPNPGTRGRHRAGDPVVISMFTKKSDSRPCAEGPSVACLGPLPTAVDLSEYLSVNGGAAGVLRLEYIRSFDEPVIPDRVAEWPSSDRRCSMAPGGSDGAPNEYR